MSFVSFVLKALVLVATLGVAACGTSAFVPPAGPGEPALDAGPAWAEATKACRDVRTYSATLRLSGRSAGQGFPTISAIVALTSRGQIFLQVVGAGRPFLTLAGTAERAVYLLHDDNRVVTARADEIVETIVGVKVVTRSPAGRARRMRRARVRVRKGHAVRPAARGHDRRGHGVSRTARWRLADDGGDSRRADRASLRTGAQRLPDRAPNRCRRRQRGRRASGCGGSSSSRSTRICRRRCSTRQPVRRPPPP